MSKPLDPFHDPLSIGNLAISKGYATPEEVAVAVKKQEMRMPLGEILVEDGILTRIQLEELLHEQQLLRAKDQNHATKMILKHQRSRIKDLSKTFNELTSTVSDFVAEGASKG